MILEPGRQGYPRRASYLTLGMLFMLVAGCKTAKVPQPASFEGWPMSRQNPAHTSRSPYTGPQKPNVKWKIQLSSIRSEPVSGKDGTIYIGKVARDGSRLMALNPDGTEKWAFKDEAEGQEVLTPAIGDEGAIYYSSSSNASRDEGRLVALSPDGRKKWAFKTEQGILTPPTIGSDGTIYIGGGPLYAISPEGEQLWKFDVESGVKYKGRKEPGSVFAAPAIANDGTVYFAGGYLGASGVKKLYALSPEGEEKWSLTVDGVAIDVPVIGHDGTIYINIGGQGEENRLAAISADGKKKWEVSRNKLMWSAPAIGKDGTVYFTGFTKTAARLHALGPNGKQKWEREIKDLVTSTPVIDKDGTIYLVGRSGLISAVMPDGTEKFVFETSVRSSNYYGWILAPTIGADGTIYFNSGVGTLCAVGSK